MKSLLLILSIIVAIDSQAKMNYKWAVKDNIKTPESVYYEPDLKLIFVSNIDGDGVKKDGQGHLSILARNGKVLNSKWITGLNAPKGMRSYQGTLWVTDIDELVEIDLSRGKILNKYKVAGAKFLNDIGISGDGEVYVSDTLTSKIHYLKNGVMETFIEGDELESPNGLFVRGEDLYVAAWGLTTDWSTKISGRLYKINLKTKKISYISKKPLGQLDGLEMDEDGNFLVSDWVAGIVYKIKPDGDTSTFFKGKAGLADIGWIPNSKTLLIPYMNDNEILGL